VLKASEGTSWMFENRVPHMLVEDKTVYSALNIIVKDIVSVVCSE
jgi:3-hydroxyisobutyrate dehydrogenase